MIAAGATRPKADSAMRRPNWWETPQFAASAVLLSAVPLLWPTIPPLTDLPGHMAQYRVMLGTDADTLSRWLAFQWRPIANLGVDLLVLMLTPWLGLEPAVKLVVVATPMLAASGMLWISREAHGRVQPTALFALPLASNYAFQFGFVNFTLAMALALNALALWMRLGRTGRVGLRAAIFVPLSVALWLAHLFGWAILGLLAFGVEAARRRDQGMAWPNAVIRGGLDCLPLALPMLAFLAWLPAGVDRGSDAWATLRMKPSWLIMILRDRWKLFDVASVTILAMLVYAGYRSRSFSTARGLSIGAVLLLATFILIPFMDSYADMRIAPYLAIVALLAIAPGRALTLARCQALALAGLAFFGVRTAGVAISLYQEGQAWERKLAVLDHLPRGSRVAALVEMDCMPPWAQFRASHLPSMAVLRRGSIANDQFVMGSDALVTILPALDDGFITDPSQLVYAPPCAVGAERRTMADALAKLPRARFDYVWLMPRGTGRPPLPTGMIPIAVQRDSLLYRIDRPST